MPSRIEPVDYINIIANAVSRAVICVNDKEKGDYLEHIITVKNYTEMLLKQERAGNVSEIKSAT